MRQAAERRRDEARALLTALLRAGGHDATEPVPERLERAKDLVTAAGRPVVGVAGAEATPDVMAAGRRAHTLRGRVDGPLAEDPATRAAAEPVLVEPPADTRPGAELAVPSPATVAGVVAWLQTKVDVRIKRKDGKTEFESGR